jgi:hypothetical protein
VPGSSGPLVLVERAATMERQDGPRNARRVAYEPGCWDSALDAPKKVERLAERRAGSVADDMRDRPVDTNAKRGGMAATSLSNEIAGRHAEERWAANDG